MTITEISQEIRDLTDTDTSSYPNTTILRRINSSLEIIVGRIERACSFPFDDENFANIAEGTIDLSEGVSKYTISDRFRQILEVKVKDVNGYYHLVEPISQSEDDIIVETEEAQKGLPTKYRMVGRTIFLRQSPTATMVTLTAGLLIKYTRTSYQITSTDLSTGSLIPGIDSVYHPLICKMSALPYCKTYKKDRVQQLENDIFVETKDCVQFYANRLKDKRKGFSMKGISFR